MLRSLQTVWTERRGGPASIAVCSTLFCVYIPYFVCFGAGGLATAAVTPAYVCLVLQATALLPLPHTTVNLMCMLIMCFLLHSGVEPSARRTCWKRMIPFMSGGKGFLRSLTVPSATHLDTQSELKSWHAFGPWPHTLMTDAACDAFQGVDSITQTGYALLQQQDNCFLITRLGT